MGIFEGMLVEGFLNVDNSGSGNTITKKNGEVTINNRPASALEISGMSLGWGLGHLIGIAITILALYFYFKCNWTKKGKFSVNASNVSDKIVGFLVSCCCSICYVAYHLAIPC